MVNEKLESSSYTKCGAKDIALEKEETEGERCRERWDRIQKGRQFRPTYRVIREESAILWEMIVRLILSKKVHMNMGPILNGYRDVKRRYGPSCEHEQQLRNK